MCVRAHTLREWTPNAYVYYAPRDRYRAREVELREIIKEAGALCWFLSAPEQKIERENVFREVRRVERKTGSVGNGKIAESEGVCVSQAGIWILVKFKKKNGLRTKRNYKALFCEFFCSEQEREKNLAFLFWTKPWLSHWRVSVCMCARRVKIPCPKPGARARADFAKSRLNWRRVVLLGDGSNGQYEKVSRRALSFPKNDQWRRRRAMIL